MPTSEFCVIINSFQCLLRSSLIPLSRLRLRLQYHVQSVLSVAARNIYVTALLSKSPAIWYVRKGCPKEATFLSFMWRVAVKLCDFSQCCSSILWHTSEPGAIFQTTGSRSRSHSEFPVEPAPAPAPASCSISVSNVWVTAHGDLWEETRKSMRWKNCSFRYIYIFGFEYLQEFTHVGSVS